MANKILTPVSLWSDFDDSLPLQETVISELRLDNVKVSEIYFSGRKAEEARVRIFATLFAPVGEGVHPALLLLSDPQKTVDVELARYFAKLGYVTLMVDLGGKDERANYTKYPESIAYANFDEMGTHYDRAEPTAKETCWYEWTAVARYAVSYLKSLSYVGKIGVIGIKDGGNVAITLLGTDDRLSCGTSLFGHGWHAYRGHYKFASDGDIEMDDERYRYLAGVDAHAYAKFAHAPFLLLTSTNHARSDFDRTFDTLARINPDMPSYGYGAVGYVGILDDPSRVNLELFLARYLKDADICLPDPIDLKCEATDGKMTISISAQPNAVSYEVFVAEGQLNPALRSWMPVLNKGMDEDGNALFTAEYFSGSKELFAFARVKYENGFTLCSEVVCRKVDGNAYAFSDRVLYSGRNGEDGMTLRRPPEDDLVGGVFLSENAPISVRKGPLGIRGICSEYGLKTYRPSSDRYRAEAGVGIKFDVYAPLSTVITLRAYDDYLAQKEPYVATVVVRGGELWQNFMLSTADFKKEDRRSPSSFAEIQVLSVDGEGEFLLNNLLWV